MTIKKESRLLDITSIHGLSPLEYDEQLSIDGGTEGGYAIGYYVKKAWNRIFNAEANENKWGAFAACG